MIRLDPRRRLSSAIGWTSLAVIVIVSVIAAQLVSAPTGRAVAADNERLLRQFATQIGHGLSMSIQTRRSIVMASAAQVLVSEDRGSEALERHLAAIQAQFPEFAWLGVADPDGRVVAAVGEAAVGDDVTAQPWFQAARVAPFVGEVHETPMSVPAAPGADQPTDFVVVAVPIRAPTARLLGIIGGYLSWRWIARFQTRLLGALETHRQLELLVVGSAGVVMAGPPTWRGLPLPAAADLTEGGAFAVGRSAVHPGDDARLAWQIVVREPVAEATAPVRALRAKVLGTVVAAGVLSGLAAFALAGALTRRLARLDADAQAVRRGERLVVDVPPGQDEASRLGQTIAELIGHLQREKAALASLNTELEARVAERTARIQRMADEARHAAVTRERLRMARDLHDTLAHSLMALLTQIRMIRKLRGRLSPQALEEEMARAEEAAASGLAEARAAIAQMRDNGVRDQGLGPAIAGLLSRLAERSGLHTHFSARGCAKDWADATAETLFRIAEEALRNVERHARARSVSVSLASPDRTSGPSGSVVLSVADDGVGFDPARVPPGHYGLAGIREQAALIGAQVEWDSAQGRGTTPRVALAV